jgi:CubicO group peptidase (beta-lactamase class C family)
MKRKILLLIFLYGIGAVWLPVLAQQAVSYDFSPIDKLLRDSAARFDGGCTLLIMQDGKIVYEKSIGFYSADTVIPIASASKWLASALCMTLYDEGRLALSDSVKKFLPYFTAEKAGITIKHLLSHTSGIAGEITAMRDPSLTLKAAAAAIGAQPLVYKPGSAFLYGGASMQVLGRIVEIAGGQRPFEALFQERIARPLGLIQTSFYGTGKTNNPLVGGGAKSSAREYARFLQMILDKGVWNGKRILSEPAVAAMEQDYTEGVQVMTYANGVLAPKQPPEKASYGLGMWRVMQPHTGELVELNSQGKWGFSPWIDRQRGLVGILSTKSNLKIMMPTYRRLKLLLRDIIPLHSFLHIQVEK